MCSRRTISNLHIQNSAGEMENDIQEEFSRSFHELISFGKASSSGVTTGIRTENPIRRRKSAVELSGLEGNKYELHIPQNSLRSSKNAQEGERPVLRRKRFTRRAQKSVCAENGEISMRGEGESSSEDEGEKRQRIRSRQHRRPLSSSASALSTTVEPDPIPSNRQRIFQAKGPTARRANRKYAQKLQQKTGSSGHLDVMVDGVSPSDLSSQKRSMSVKDLHGEDVDFSNQDNVTRWASQILAELDSLPSSRIDLRDCGLDGGKDRLSAISSPLLCSPVPPIPTHRHSMFIPSEGRQMLPSNGLMSTSVNEKLMMSSLNNNISDIPPSSALSRLSILSHPDQVRKSCDLDVPDTTSRSMTYSGFRGNVHTEESHRRSSLSVDSDSTPRASPTPDAFRSDEIKQMEFQKTCSPPPLSVAGILDVCLRNEYSTGEGGELVPPIPMRRRTSADAKTSTENAPTANPPSSTDHSEDFFSPARRSSEGSKEFLDDSDVQLMSSISRLTRSIYGEMSDEGKKTSDVRHSISSAFNWNLQKGDDPLSRWRKEVDCRVKNPQMTPETNGKSVNRVVASLIRAAEESRFTSEDRPDLLHLPTSPAQDVGTQTTPLSISRSSSFDWINEPNEKILKDFRTPLSTPRKAQLLPSLPDLHQFCPSPSSSTECDIEVTEMTKGRRSGLHNALDESLALLLQCANDGERSNQTPKPKPRTKLPLTNEKETSSDHHPPAPHRRILKAKGNSESLPTDFRKLTAHQGAPPVGGNSAPTVMSDSVYDNVPGRKSRKSSEEPSSSSIPSTRSPPRELRSSLTAASDVIASLSCAQTANRRSNNAFPLRIGDRAGSCELLSTDSPDRENAHFQSKLRKAEEDAEECCDWLRNAGFPQYAKEYEDGHFPLDLKSVNLDHTFLDADSLAALYRRLSTLNRTAIMRTDQVVLRRTNENRYDSSDNEMNVDYEDDVALSQRWRFQRNSHTWSRVGNEPIYGADRNTVSTSQNNGSEWNRSRRGLERTHLETVGDVATSSREHERSHRSLQRSQSERIKERARAFMKKIDIRSSSRRRKPQNAPMVIGDPVLVSYDTTSPESRRMLPGEYTYVGSRGRSKSSKRQGMLLLMSPSSPDSSTASEDSLTQRRDRSVPAHRVGKAEVRYLPPYSSAITSGYDQYLYPKRDYSTRTPRATSRPPHLFRADLHTSAYPNSYSPSLDSTLSNSSFSPFSQRFLSPPLSSKATTLSRQPNVHMDGYFVHEMSPDTSLSRSLYAQSPPLGREKRRNREMGDAENDFLMSSMRDSEMRNPAADMVGHLRVATGEAKQSCSSLDESEDHSHTLTSQRRDSGVGSSLSRSPSGPSTHRQRASLMPFSSSTLSSLSLTAPLLSNSLSNGSYTARRKPIISNSQPMTSSLASSTMSGNSSKEEETQTFFTDMQLVRSIDSLGIVELSRIRKLAYLRVTALFEREERKSGIRIGSIPFDGGQAIKHWTVQKLISKISKNSDSKMGKEDNCVFGQPLESINRRSGCSLPRSMLEVLRYLRQMAPETVGIFRKNGVRSRITELRRVADTHCERDVFVGENRLESGQVHDVADMLKQYLRELPEPLMTQKLSETFANIFQFLPEHERSLALQYSLLLLPDENREALQTLLFFLHDVARHSDCNSMTSQNLAVCFTPSLFHLSASRLNTISSTRRHKTIGASGMPTEKEMKETRAAQACLTFLIDDCRSLFLVPDSLPCGLPEYEEDHPTLNQIGGVGYRSYLVRKIKDLLKEHADKWRGWSSESQVDGIEISSKKALDVHPLKTYRVTVDVEAPPREVLQRILRERPVWDPSVINWRLVENLQSDTDLFQYVLNDTPGHPTRDFHVVRMYRSELSEIRGACCLVERSVHCADSQLLGGISGAVLDNRILIEPNSGRSKVTFLSRVDMRGRGIHWYNTIYGCILARQMSRLRDSFHQSSEHGPETKL